MAKREREGLVGNANRAEEADAGGRVPELSGAEDREPTIKERVEAITGVRSLREARGRVVPSLVFVRLAVLVGLPGEDWGLERLQAGPKSKTSAWREFFEEGLYLGELPGEGGDGGRWTIGRGADGVAWLAKIAPKMTLTPGEEVGDHKRQPGGAQDRLGGVGGGG